MLLENVEGLLDRISEGPPAIEYVVGQLEEMGYSWAYRIVNTAGAVPSVLLLFAPVLGFTFYPTKVLHRLWTTPQAEESHPCGISVRRPKRRAPHSGTAILASMSANVQRDGVPSQERIRDAMQGAGYCHGACRHIFNGNSCYLCHQNDEAEEDNIQHTYAVDLGNAQ